MKQVHKKFLKLDTTISNSHDTACDPNLTQQWAGHIREGNRKNEYYRQLKADHQAKRDEAKRKRQEKAKVTSA